MPTGLKNTKHPEFYGEPDSGSPLKVCVYINCIFAEAWPSDGKMSDGHVAFYSMADYKAVTFWLVFPSALFMSDGNSVFYSNS